MEVTGARQGRVEEPSCRTFGSHHGQVRGTSARSTSGGSSMSVKDRITAKLSAALNPQALEVIDDSHRHAGHIGHPGSGHPGTTSATETHFTVKVVSDSFAGKTRLQRHRLVNDLLAEELSGPVHALAIHANAP